MCNHEHLKAVCSKKERHLFCLDCGAEVPFELLTKKEEPKQEEKPKRSRKKVTE